MAGTANSIITPQTPLSKMAVCTSAETTFNNPSNAVTLLDDATQNTNGVRINTIYAISRSSVVTACNCQLYKKSGSVYTLLSSVILATGTPSAAVANQVADFGYTDDNPLVLESGVGLAVAIGQSIPNGVAFLASGGSY